MPSGFVAVKVDDYYNLTKDKMYCVSKVEHVADETIIYFYDDNNNLTFIVNELNESFDVHLH